MTPDDGTPRAPEEARDSVYAGPAEEPDAGPAGGAGDDDAEETSGAPGADGGARRRRRRRRRRPEAAASGGDPASEPSATASPAAPAGGRPPPAARRGGEPRRDGRDGRDDRVRGREDRAQRSSAHPDGGAARSGEAHHRSRTSGDSPARSSDDRGAERGRGRDGRGGGEPRGERAGRGEPRGDHPREARSRGQEPPPASRAAEPGPPHERQPLLTSTFEGPTTRLAPRRPVVPADDLDLEGSAAPAIPWGTDDDGPPAEVTLAPDLPADAPADDPDPLTYPLLDLPSAPLGDDIASVAGVCFVPGGRVQWYDAEDADYARGERVMVDAERGARLAWIAVPPTRRPIRERGLRRVIRRANEQDLRVVRDGEADRAHALRVAKDKAAALRLPLKVFRVEVHGQIGRGARINVYYTSDERLDLRDFLRDVSAALGGARIELRQLGVRDEAKAVGGIGSCGLTLCCTTWLPDFVPVSIKMAKDQGLVLSPTKVSGQCGRLKCCLVYEQAAYAELRKGLPKLGKRVIGAHGEGRVVEVDVLRQRVRVSYGPGETEVVPASEVRPMFPSGNQPAREADAPEPDDADAGDSLELPANFAGMADPSLAAAVPDDDAPLASTNALADDDPS
ncbi:MAG TPA: regulatory iron-sulfur-containing complex subunit RicT [Kofleriaceae bacterium]|jgi:cell fate regulator YaaT (PSP1 superfamily)|nr:regulatory iron-sulfur-containing complex subunit RicT [Kofleriaceae bacterium]